MTFWRMSAALAVQMSGLGFLLCTAMYSFDEADQPGLGSAIGRHGQAYALT